MRGNLPEQTYRLVAALQIYVFSSRLCASVSAGAEGGEDGEIL